MREAEGVGRRKIVRASVSAVDEAEWIARVKVRAGSGMVQENVARLRVRVR